MSRNRILSLIIVFVTMEALFGAISAGMVHDIYGMTFLRAELSVHGLIGFLAGMVVSILYAQHLWDKG